ncbi:MAG: DUF167 domain-containing protein [Promethearchaeota archaeon]
MTDFLEKSTDNSILLRIKVKPNSKKQHVSVDGEFLRVHVKSKALHNKANIELVKIIKTKLEVPTSNIQIIKGTRSNFKTLKITFSDQVIEKKIQQKLIC